MAESTPKDALKGWKSIAGYFGRDESTVMRWAAQRGLPVRRVPGAQRSSVYALPDELAAWLATTAPADASPPAAEPPIAAVPPPTRKNRLPYAMAATVGAGLVAIGLLAGRSPAVPVAAPAFRDAATERAFLAATYDRDQRTPASLTRAVDEFGAIIAREPTAAPAYAALGETYLLLREYSEFPGDEAYRDAAAAAKAAIALSPDLLAAHRALAFVAFWHDDDIATARAEFARARRLGPHDAKTWHWYATALSANGENEAALDAIGEARRLEPQSTAIAADYGLLAYLAGRRAEGLAALQTVAAEAPAHMSTHRYLADLALARGDGRTYLDEAAIACRLKGDGREGAVLAGDRAAFARSGEAGLLAAIAARVDQQAGSGDDHFARAKIAAMQGRTADAIDQLHAAAAAHEAAMAGLPGEIMLRGLSGMPAFETLRRRDSLVATTGVVPV